MPSEDTTVCLGRGCPLTARCIRYLEPGDVPRHRSYIADCVPYDAELTGTAEDYPLFIERDDENKEG